MNLKNDEYNLLLADSPQSVDELNAEFYSKYPYPWPPIKFDYLLDPNFETTMLSQSVGDWQHKRLPENPKIWIVGCGTNQAIFTALKFPNATIIGSDLSKNSLSLCARNAKQLGIKNLQLKNESINQASYQSQFDFVICTGVIHHNSDPQAALEQLSQALKPDGIVELMVYNRFHRILTTASQKAIMMIEGNNSAIDFELEFNLAKKIIAKFPQGTLFSALFSQYKNSPEALVADALLQPVEYSYTVESLESIAESCDLQLITPCLNAFDKDTKTFLWNMEFDDPDLSQRYYSMPDVMRWQVTNLLLSEKSPMLWFYLQKNNCVYPIKSEHQLCEEFLNTKFVHAKTEQRSFIRDKEENYSYTSQPIPFPLTLQDPAIKSIYNAVNGKHTMKEIFENICIDQSFYNTNKIRINLTTTIFPYLKAIK